MKKIRAAYSIIFVFAWATGCYYDKEELVYPKPAANGCDTTNIRYSIEVRGILSADCDVCHSGLALGGGGIRLNDFAVLKQMVNNGKLIRSIQHASGASPMPEGGAKLPDCSIAKIQAWINKGAQQN